MKKLLVPSDVTLLEEKYSIGRRRLTALERTGLLGMPPMLHLQFTKNDKHDMRRVLSNQFDTNSTDPVIEILRARQASIRKQVLAHNGVWMGAGVFTIGTWYSLRNYDYKAKAIVLPFVAYGGSWIGRWVADCLTGRWKELARNRVLGELPPMRYFVMPNAPKS